MNITIVGTAWPYRGGIAVFSERLAREFMAQGHQVKLYTFTLQYPSLLFPGETQYSSEPAPADLQIERKLSSVNPFTWFSLGRRIRKEAPDLVVFAYWIPFMAPCMGTTARIARRNGKTKVVVLCHNFIPHEKRLGDMFLSKYLVHSVDGVTALSQNVCDDVHKFVPGMPTVASPHPLYDSFGEPVSHEEACRYLGLDPQYRYLMFFGLIRDYKGLDWLIEAYAKAKDVLDAHGCKLIVAGEFYSGRERYHALAQELGVEEGIIWKTQFVPDHEVRYYFSAAELIMQTYKSATQSGVSQIAYHFEKPMLVTRVGGLPEIVPDGKVGYAVEPHVDAIAAALADFAKDPHKEVFAAGIKEEKKKYGWDTMAHAIISLIQ